MLHFKFSQNYFAEIEQAAFAPGHMVNVTDLEQGRQLTTIVYTFRLRASNHLKIPSFSPASSLIRVCVSSVLGDGRHADPRPDNPDAHRYRLGVNYQTMPVSEMFLGLTFRLSI